MSRYAGLNNVVMGHTGVTWEIALPFVAIFVFITLVEAWKFAKRVYYRRQLKKKGVEEGEEAMTGVFAAWKTMDVSNTQNV